MIDLSIHISKLLFDNDKVIIPGLGIFEALPQKTYHHPVSHEFAPKYKKIIFTRDTTIQDALLANSLDISNANELIKEFTESLISELTKTKKYKLENIGWLKQLSTGAVIFEQDKNFNYEKSYFGMEAFKMPTVEIKKDTVSAPKPQPISQPKPKSQSQQISQSIPKSKPQSKTSKSKLWLWLVLIGSAAVVIFASIIYSDYFLVSPEKKEIVKSEEVGSLNEKTNTDNSEIIKQDTAIVEEVDNETVEDGVLSNQEETDNTPNIEEKPVKVIDQNTNINKQYYVIAGCFRSETKANDYLYELKNNGYPNASIEGKTKGGLTRVCYDGFGSRSAADKYLDEVSAKENKELWIQKIKK